MLTQTLALIGVSLFLMPVLFRAVVGR